jgi:hypothetical protein
MLFVALTLVVRRKIKWGVILGATALLYFNFALPAAKPARPIAQRNTCMAQAKVINQAIEQWSKENNMADGSEIDLALVASKLKGGKLPVCAQGGPYKLTVIGKPVVCSLPEHANTGR